VYDLSNFANSNNNVMKKLYSIICALFLINASAFSQCNDLFISEYVEGSGNNKALEIYNPTNEAINLGDYRIIRWANGAISPPDDGIMPLPANLTIAAKDVIVIALNLTDPNGTGQTAPIAIALQEKADTLLSNGCGTEPGNIRTFCFNGDDALSLEKNVGGTWTRVDIFACIGEQPTNSQGTASPTAGWTDLSPFSSMPVGYTTAADGPYFFRYWTQDKTLIRKSSVNNGVTTNPQPQSFNASVQWDSLATDMFDSLGFHNCVCNTVGFNDLPESEKLTVYPNPSNDKVSFQSELAISQVVFHNITGQIIASMENPLLTNNVRIDTHQIPSGVYSVKLKYHNGAQASRRIIIQH
jgi:hypothetical protein